VLTLINRPIRSPVDITRSAIFVTRKLRNIINNRLTGRGSAVGDPRIRAGAVIRLNGLGTDFSGDYRVTSATHTIGKNGYRTDFTVRKEIIP
jgi:phage protein D